MGCEKRIWARRPSPRAQSTKKRKSAQKKFSTARKTKRIVSARDLGRMIKIQRPPSLNPTDQSCAALHDLKHARHTPRRKNQPFVGEESEGIEG
jgi:hypothetical protein